MQRRRGKHLAVRSALDYIIFDLKKGDMKEMLPSKIWRMEKIA